MFPHLLKAMGVSYDLCENPDCGKIVCDHDPDLKRCEECESDFCGNDDCNGVMELNCEECNCELPLEEHEQEPPHMLCIKCVEGSWPAERFRAFLLKRAGFTTMKQARDAFDEQENVSSEEESDDE